MYSSTILCLQFISSVYLIIHTNIQLSTFYNPKKYDHSIYKCAVNISLKAGTSNKIHIISFVNKMNVCIMIAENKTFRLGRTSLFIYIYHVYPCCLCFRGSWPVPVNSLFVLYYTHCTQIYIQTSSVLSLE